MSVTHWAPLPFAEDMWTQVRLEDDVEVLRSVALRLRDGALAVVGPIVSAPPATLDQLASFGRPSLLLAPNKFHNMGLRRFAERFEPCIIVASDRAAGRVAKRSGCLLLGLDRLAERLPEHIRLLEPAGTRNGEVWLRVETTRGVAWVVGDAFFNVPRVPRTLSGLLFPLLGVTSGLRVGPTFRWIALRDEGTYARWLATQLDADRPAILVPAHGEVDDGPDLPERLRRAAATRLPAMTC